MLVAGASSVVALGVGLLIGAFAIDTSGGNEFAYQAKITKIYVVINVLFIQKRIFVGDFLYFDKQNMMAMPKNFSKTILTTCPFAVG